MSGYRELEPLVDLPNGTTAIVKVQRPPASWSDDLSWMVFARGRRHLRLYKREGFPTWLVEMMSIERKLYVTAEVRDGEWHSLSAAPDQPW